MWPSPLHATHRGTLLLLSLTAVPNALAAAAAAAAPPPTRRAATAFLSPPPPSPASTSTQRQRGDGSFHRPYDHYPSATFLGTPRRHSCNWRPFLSSPSITAAAPTFRRTATTATMSSRSSDDATTQQQQQQQQQQQSTLRFLSDVSLTVPPSQQENDVLDFYTSFLGCGGPLEDDSRCNDDTGGGGENVRWVVECGPNRFLLRQQQVGQDGDVDVLPAHVGLRYDSLDELKARIKGEDSKDEKKKSGANERRCFSSYDVGVGPDGREVVTLTDWGGNVFRCRAGRTFTTTSSPETDCRGIDYVEYPVPHGTASKIATFYDCVLDAPTSIVRHGDDGDAAIAIVGLGTIDDDGRAEQNLLFRESSSSLSSEAPPLGGSSSNDCDGNNGDGGRSIVLYVGENSADLDAAHRNCEQAGVIINQEHEAKADANEFRFVNVVDLRDGSTVFRLGHVVRSGAGR